MRSLDPASVDTPRLASVSFAPPEAAAPDVRPLTVTGRHPVPVGPGRPTLDASSFVPRGGDDRVIGYPVQPAKVQRPPVREETLARPRLLNWLQAKIHQRVVLVVAEAGYGKTTLLADFSRRTRVRTLWYRLDEEDQGWVSFLNHLVASGREHDPSFAPISAGLLSDMTLGGPPRDGVLDAFLRDLEGLGPGGAVFVLDDYHLVDESSDVRTIMRQLIARAPERVSFAIASRRPPGLPLARLRAQGELAELSTNDLRFDATETEQLFRETYGRPLDPDVLAELSDRTEGWAASLQLVRAALRDRSPGEVRSFVASLSGAEGDLHDYLAEEVVGDLPPPLQSFLMRTAVLETVSPELAAVAAGVSRLEAKTQMELAERVGLLHRSRQDPTGERRYHPLVRTFLEHRLLDEIGCDKVHALHRAVASAAEGTNWMLACHHYGAIDDGESVRRVIAESIEAILGSGDVYSAASFLDRFPPPTATAPTEIVLSRADLGRGQVGQALSRAAKACALAPESDLALSNLAALEFSVGNAVNAVELASLLAQRSTNPELLAIAVASLDVLQPSNADVGDVGGRLRSLALAQLSNGRRHYAGVSLLNAAVMEQARGAAAAALQDATRALDILRTSSGGIEAAAASMVRAWALAHLGDLELARLEVRAALDRSPFSSQAEILVEAADIETFYGSAQLAEGFLHEASELAPVGEVAKILLAASAQLRLRQSQVEAALALVSELDPGVASAWPALAVRHQSLRAHVALLIGEPDSEVEIRTAREAARRRGAAFWQRYLSVLTLVGQSLPVPPKALQVVRSDTAYLSLFAELISKRLHELCEADLQLVTDEARRRPDRWRPHLRKEVDDPLSQSQTVAARLLEWVGSSEDVPRLRSLAKSLKGKALALGLGSHLARRIATRVYVEDQGRVVIRVGDRVVPGTEVRRKVLALLCFLLSRPRFSATRDQVIDAIWPDLDPDTAVNSLNQTVYFLRRVFEPTYNEETSPNYLHHDSDILWLDEDLVASRSRDCTELLRALPVPTAPADIDQISARYMGKFALDFIYEDWAVSYRDTLHASYLQVVETAVLADITSGHYERAIRLSRRALEIDPEAEHLEALLLRLYRLAGAHAAAAEQYEHYSSVLRLDLGVEAPPLEQL